ncbi:MAG: hypothetical protein ACI9DJ_000167 [Algoriphagus sp.]
MKSETFPANEVANKELKELSSKLSSSPPIWHRTSLNSTQINETAFTAKENAYGIKSFTFDIADDQGEVVFETENDSNTLIFGMEKWRDNNSYSVNDFPVAGRIYVSSLILATATWLEDNTLQINRKFVEAIHGDTLVCFFDGDKVTIEFNNSVSQNSGSIGDGREALVAFIWSLKPIKIDIRENKGFSSPRRPRQNIGIQDLQKT